ncbi:MAG TPA: TetR/AcrR family transcriptional regulator, partial [Eubacteriaceae bacterium]|nr:TetR/AcrR family transcriptional regulator [Eubacteriaceae bacterium]
IRIEDICRKAEVSTGTFYTYFTSKNDILELIFKQSDDFFKDEVRKKLKDYDPVEGVVEFFQMYADYNTRTGLTTLNQMYNPENKFFAKKRGMQEVLEEVIERGQEEGAIKQNCSAEQLVEYLFIVARGVVFDWCLKDGKYSLPDKMIPMIQKYIEAESCV